MRFDSEDLKPCKTTLTGFNGEDTHPKGYIDLKLTLGTKQAFKTEVVCLIVADFPSPYNMILGQPTIHDWNMLVSSNHQKLKFFDKKKQVVTVKGDKKDSRQCYFEAVQEGKESSRDPKGKTVNKSVHVVELDVREEDKIQRAEPNDEVEDFILGDKPEQTMKIGKMLDPEVRVQLEEFLTANKDVFAWKPSEIPGIDPGFCCHKLAIISGSVSVAQRKRK